MSSASTVERQMLDLINEERKAAGLDPLRLESRLNESSERHSEWMLETDTFSHTGAGGSKAGDRMEDAGFEFSGNWTWAENVAWQSERGAPGLSDDVADLHASLMDSPGHRDNILNPDVEVVGIGIEAGEYDGWEAVMVTQNFARSAAPMDYDSPDVTDSPDGTASPAPDGNAPPAVEVDDVALAAGSGAELAGRIDYTDADGDAAARFEIRGADGTADVLVDGRVVDVSSGHVLDAADLESLELRAGEPGSRETLEVRAHDGQDWGDWDAFTVTTAAAPAENRAPELSVEDISAAPGEKIPMADRVTVDDADGDDLRWVQIYDRGADNFGLDNRTIDADRGRWLTQEQFQDLWVTGDAEPSVQTLAIRAYDGEDLGQWETFSLATEWDTVA